MNYSEIKNIFCLLDDCYIDKKTISSLINNYANISEAERIILRDSVPMEDRLTILSITEKLATLAYKYKDCDYLIAALTLISIEDFKWDERESIIYLSIIWFVSEKLKCNSVDLFNKIISVSSKDGTASFNNFLNRDSSLKSLKAMRLRAIEDNDNITFEQIPPPWMH